MVEVEAGHRFVHLDPVSAPEKNNGIVPVGETAGVHIIKEIIALGIDWCLSILIGGQDLGCNPDKQRRLFPDNFLIPFEGKRIVYNYNFLLFFGSVWHITQSPESSCPC